MSQLLDTNQYFLVLATVPWTMSTMWKLYVLWLIAGLLVPCACDSSDEESGESDAENGSEGDVEHYQIVK